MTDLKFVYGTRQTDTGHQSTHTTHAPLQTHSSCFCVPPISICVIFLIYLSFFNFILYLTCVVFFLKRNLNCFHWIEGLSKRLSVPEPNTRGIITTTTFYSPCFRFKDLHNCFMYSPSSNGIGLSCTKNSKSSKVAGKGRFLFHLQVAQRCIP